MAKEQFYADGIHFECTGCGNCCKLAGGYVYVTEEEIKAMAKYTKQSITQFTDQYVETYKNKYVLKSKADACIFLENDSCIVYPVRPVQCRTFPFWPANLKSKYRWKMVLLECEGIGRGKLYALDEIETIIKTQIPTAPGPDPDDRALLSTSKN